MLKQPVVPKPSLVGCRDLEYGDAGEDSWVLSQPDFIAVITCCLTNIYSPLCPILLGWLGAQHFLQTYAKVVGRFWVEVLEQPVTLLFPSCLALMAGAAAAILRQWRKEQMNCRDLNTDNVELLNQQPKLPPPDHILRWEKETLMCLCHCS